MREIKFRIWDERAKQYADTKKCVYIVGVLHNNKIVLGFDSPKSEYSLGLVLEQFTGLLDKNGKEIYEGDILRGYGYDGSAKDCLGKVLWTRPVIFANGMFTTDDEKNEIIGYDILSKCRFEEVIGNIHDNPKLLKGETNV